MQTVVQDISVERLLADAPLPAEAERTPLTWGVVVGPGAAAVRRLWVPFALLQVLGLAVVIFYFRVAGVRQACDALAVIKLRGGYAFSAAAMALCGGLMPEVCKFITGIDRRLGRRRGRDVLFVMSLFACCGIASDAFYRLLAATLGNAATPGNIAAKVAIDQFIYTPLVGVCAVAAAFAWRRLSYDTLGLLRQLSFRWYLLTVMPLLLPAWAYWIPMTSFMYALPGSLTFVYGAIATAAISLIYTTVATAEKN